MKRIGFTLIELILVIVLLGALATIATSLSRPDRVLNDTHFVLAKILQARYEAIGYDHRNFDRSWQNSGIGCVTLLKNSLEGNLSKAGSYRMKEDTQITVSGMKGNTLCFDVAGRPHDGDFSLSSLLHVQVDIAISNGKRRHDITLYPISGYVTIKE